jgi:hypothetical protein
MTSAENIADPAIRAAALRFERETGRSLARELGDERDEAIIGIFLIVNGYPPHGADPGPPAPALPAA